MGQRTEFCLDHSGVMCIPGLPETTFNAEGCYIFAGVQFGKLAQLQVPRMVGLVAEKVGDLLHELLVDHHFTKVKVCSILDLTSAIVKSLPFAISS